MKNQVSSIVSEFAPKLIEIRRRLHEIPELGNQEHKTTALIAAQLAEAGLTLRPDIEGTGVIAEIEGADEKIVGLRVDIDALPIEELTGVSYASKNNGLMHACGHDVHTTVGIGVAHVLKALAEKPPWTVRLLFQPAEELQPGGSVGFIKQGALRNMSAIFGVHVDPGIEVGNIGLKYGPHLASVDVFEIEIFGKGGHAAHPHLAVDSIYIAAKAVTALQSIPARNIDPVKPAVLTVTSIHGGRAKNIIPESVKLAGTIRTLDNGVRAEIPELMKRVLAGVTQAFGGDFTIELTRGSSVLVNDKVCTQVFQKAATELLGEKHVQIIQVPRMGSEDFANYLDHIPGAMMRLGVSSSAETSHSLHSPYFNIDESAIPIGVEVLVRTLLDYMKVG